MHRYIDIKCLNGCASFNIAQRLQYWYVCLLCYPGPKYYNSSYLTSMYYKLPLDIPPLMCLPCIVGVFFALLFWEVLLFGLVRLLFCVVVWLGFFILFSSLSLCGCMCVYGWGEAAGVVVDIFRREE